MKQSVAGTLSIVRLDAFEATGHQNPARVFTGSNWCESTPAELEERKIFDRGGCWLKEHGVVLYVDDDDGTVITFEENGSIVPRRLLPGNSKCDMPLSKGDRVCVHLGMKKKKVFVYVEFAPYEPPTYSQVPG